MAYVEVSSQGWLSRIMKSVGGAVIGFLLFVVAFPVLFWNEGRAVQTMRSLEEGQGAVVKASADKVEAGNEQKLIHLSGDAQTTEKLKDPDFGVSAVAIRLERTAEMYQWRQHSHSEEHKKLGGGTETVTTYTYDKGWEESPIDSSSFKQRRDPDTGDVHTNPATMKYRSIKYQAKKVTLGAFALISEQVDKIGGEAPLEVTRASLENAPRTAKPQSDGVVFIGEDPESPAIGNYRISFKVVKPGPVSVIGQQVGSSFQPYQTKAGDALLLVQDGLHTADQMFQKAQEDNTVLTWFLRILGFAMMGIGLALVFKPLSVLGDVIPFVGTLIGAGVGLFAFLISAALSLLTVAIAWIFYRPLLGIPLLLLAGGALYLVFARGRKKKASLGEAPGMSRAA